MRLIDADALHDSIDKETYRHTYIEQIHSIIDNAPTIDAVPVVHCKDCEYWTKQSDSLQGRCALSDSYPTGAWYCANGERREPCTYI